MARDSEGGVMKEYFFTGSQVYGHKYKTEGSDLDIAVLVTANEFTMLRKLCSCGGQRVGPLMFSKINFVCFNSDYDEEKSRFYTWYRITEYLKEKLFRCLESRMLKDNTSNIA